MSASDPDDSTVSTTKSILPQGVLDIRTGAGAGSITLVVIRHEEPPPDRTVVMQLKQSSAALGPESVMNCAIWKEVLTNRW